MLTPKKGLKDFFINFYYDFYNLTYIYVGSE